MLGRLRVLYAVLTLWLAAAMPDPALADPLTEAQAAWEQAVAATGPQSPDAIMAEWDLAQRLDQAGRLQDGERHWRHMVGLAEPLGDQSSLLAQFRLRLVMNQVRQDGFEETITLAEAALPVLLAEAGPDHELVDGGRLALATAYMMRGQYAQAEAPARLAFEAALTRNAGRGAAPYALMLQQIYTALGRDADARQVMARADPTGGEYSAQVHQLTALREAAAWADLALAARRYGDDWRARPDDPIAATLAEDADLDVVLALTELARSGQAADFAEAERTVDRVIAARRSRGQDWPLARALAAKSSLYFTWPGHEDIGRATPLRGQALTAIEADLGPDHPAALSERLIYGSLLLQSDPEAAAPVLTAYYDAARRGRVRADAWATAAVLLSDVLAQADEPSMAYALIAEAAEGLRTYATAPDRFDDQRQTLNRHAALFRAQVGHAWTLAQATR